ARRENLLRCRIVRRLPRSRRTIRDISGGTSSRVPRPDQLRIRPRKPQQRWVQSQRILQVVCGWLLPEILLPEGICTLSNSSRRILKSSARLAAFHHLPAIGVKRVINNPLGRIDFMVVAEVQLSKSLGDRIQSSSLGLMPQRVVRVGAVYDFSQQPQRRVCRQIVLF